MGVKAFISTLQNLNEQIFQFKTTFLDEINELVFLHNIKMYSLSLFFLLLPTSIPLFTFLTKSD